MKALLLLLFIIALLALILYLRRALTAATCGGFVTTQDFPALTSALQASGSSGAFWVVLIPGTARADGYTANLQYSIEDGVFGMDWVLIAERNIEDKERFLEYVRGAGASVQEKTGNGVRYLRATGGFELVRVGQELLERVYGVKPGAKLQLIVAGFKWQTPTPKLTA